MSIGYIGLGDVGGPIAGHIAGAFDLTVFDLDPAKVAALTAKGAKAGTSVIDVASKVDTLFLCLPNLKAAHLVLFGPEGVVNAPTKPKLIVDNSTITPQDARDISERLKQAGIRMVDAPFSGGATGARLGTLAVIAGGDAADIETARPAIETFSSRFTHMGPIGSGQATKACNQIMDYAIVAAIGEAIAFGRAFGIDVEKMPMALEGGLGDSAILREYARELAEGKSITSLLVESVAGILQGRIDPACRGKFDISLKDIDIVIETARINGSAVPMSSIAGNLLRMLNVQPAGS